MYFKLEHLYSIAPALRMLNVQLTKYHPAQQIYINPLENLKQLSLNIRHLYFNTSEQLLYPMKRLTDLIIIAYDVYHAMSDGAKWERILTKIISFKIWFRFDESTWIEESIKLDSFQTAFWLENRPCYVGYDRCTVRGFSLLYSIHYFMNRYPWYDMKGSIQKKSTKRQILSLNNINRLTIHKQFLIDNEPLCRLTNLQQLYINDSPDKFSFIPL